MPELSQTQAQMPTFQSTPAPKGGRCTPGPHMPRDSYGFQSTPAPKGGRCLQSATVTAVDLVFQSTPAPKGGRCVLSHRKELLQQDVSIHTRPERRAMQTRSASFAPATLFQSTPAPKGGRCSHSSPQVSIPRCFNPHPPRKAGDAQRRAQIVRGKGVSIHTRPERRAMQGSGGAPAVATLFQSTPAPKGGRCIFYRVRRGNLLQFQSTPAPKGGRCLYLE